MPFTTYIGIGSNQPHGDQSPGQLVAAAIHELEKLGRVSARSSLYGTQPVGLIAQPAFINAAAEVLTSHGPEELLEALIQIECGFGRDRAVAVPRGPRTLDLDLLFAITGQGEGIIHSSPLLTLPHPEAAHRRFVLAPLAEIAPGLHHPVLKKTIAELLAELPDEGSNAIAAVRVIENVSGKAR